MIHESWLGLRRDVDSEPKSSRPAFTTTGDQYAHDIYRDLAEGETVDAFLPKTPAFDLTNKQWALPQAPSITEHLATSAFRVVRAILLRFAGPSLPGVEREVRNMVKANAKHPKREDGYDICPPLVVRGSGPSFENPVPIPNNCSATVRPTVSFGNMASFITVKPESQVGDLKEVLKEMNSHARELFRYQPNRFYVRSILLTEKHARLVHFDRAGAQTTPPVNIHQSPATFVRLILGISSTNERLLGLDDSVQWTIVDGQKGKGTLTTTDSSGTSKAYTVLGRLPVPRDTVEGRGTTCWSVQDPETLEIFVIKDSWRLEERLSEHEFLEHARNIAGVVCMVSYELERGETKQFRCPTTTTQCYNRCATRIVLKTYGKPIVFFTSVLQVLGAMRDAIAGHQQLSNAGILHRDVSSNNILFSLDGGSEGERGVLIDLEMAFWSTDANPGVKVDHTIGTRLFQSVSVLDSFAPMGFVPDHDYLDDLESFLYVLTYILLLFRPDGSLLPSTGQGPKIVHEWNLDDPDMADYNKRSFYGTQSTALTALRIIKKTWHPACATLFKDFHDFIMFTAEKKTLLIHGQKEGAPRDLLNPLLSHRDEHYAEVLSMFDKAINAVQRTTTAQASRRQAPVSAATGSKARPAAVPPTSSPKAAPTLRRSTRIRNLHLEPTEQPTSNPLVDLPRRSTRIQKRRLDESERSEAPPPKARRTTKRSRSTNRAR